MVAETESLVVPCPYSWPRLRRACFFFVARQTTADWLRLRPAARTAVLEGFNQLALFTIAEGQEKGSIVGSRFWAMRCIAAMSEAVRSIHYSRHRTVIDGEAFGDDARSRWIAPQIGAVRTAKFEDGLVGISD